MKRMKGRYKVISIFTFLLLILQILLITTTHAIDLYFLDNQKNIKIVDKTGNWDYINIQEAIDNEPEGTTIFIKNGIYNEILYIDKKINLIGENKDNTIILSESMQNRYSICLNSPNVKLENLSIKNSGPGLYCSGIKITAPNTQINDCFIYDTPVGIAIFTSYNTINNCEFYGCSDEGGNEQTGSSRAFEEAYD